MLQGSFANVTVIKMHFKLQYNIWIFELRKQTELKFKEIHLTANLTKIYF